MQQTIKLDKDRELKFNLNALTEINKKYGSIEKMEEALNSGEGALAIVDDLVWLITLLVNQPIIERNMDIQFGVATGEPEKLLTEDYVRIKLDMKEIISQKGNLFASLVEGMTFSAVDSEEETDEVLKEIDQEKNV